MHFIRFPTDQMDKFLNMVVEKQFALLIDTFQATGGGAYKFEEMYKTNVKIQFNKLDELDCLIKGTLVSIKMLLK